MLFVSCAEVAWITVSQTIHVYHFCVAQLRFITEINQKIKHNVSLQVEE